MAKGTAVAKAKLQLPANVAQQLAAEAASIASRISAPSGDRIKVTQSKRFRLPSGEESAGPINAVIVDFVSMNMFYDGAFDPNDITPPICAAIGTEPTTLAPYADSTEKQCDTCSACPQNQFGSSGKGKACSNTRLLAIMAVDANADTPMMLLKVSPTALRSFDGYVGSVARSFKMPPFGVITEISLDPTSDYPSLRFGNPTPCAPELLALAMSRRDEARARLMTKPDFAANDVAKAAPKKKVASRRGA